MIFLYRYLFTAMWLSWAVYWWMLKRDVKATTRHEPRWSRLAHVIPLLLAAVLLGIPRMRIPILGDRFIPMTWWSVLDWRDTDRRGPVVHGLGAHPHRQELERYGYHKGGP